MRLRSLLVENQKKTKDKKATMMIDNNLLISVIMAVYNGERYIAEAIESILGQTYRPIEIVVVDDGSTDGSADIIKSFADPQIRYFYQDNRGLSAARNQGTNLAQGSFFAFLDADDVWLVDKLTLQIEAFKSNPTLDMVFGYVDQFYSPDLNAHAALERDHEDKIMPGYSAGTMLIKQESFALGGPFTTTWRVGQFIDWYLKAVDKGLKSLMLPTVVMKRRIHNANMSIRERNSRADYVRIVKAALDRRRKRHA